MGGGGVQGFTATIRGWLVRRADLVGGWASGRVGGREEEWEGWRVGGRNLDVLDILHRWRLQRLLRALHLRQGLGSGGEGWGGGMLGFRFQGLGFRVWGLGFRV